MSYVRFYSASSFTLGTNGNIKKWNGTASNAMEYSTDESTWTSWDGTAPISAGLSGSVYNLYLRGTGNTRLTTATSQSTEVITYSFEGNDLIDSEGNIESLFDYATVDNNQHPTMNNLACASMFYGQSLLRTAPSLDFISLVNACYARMFMNCTSLVTAPNLPATTLASYCYSNMFKGCSSLTTAPTLSVTDLSSADSCYRGMFAYCTSLLEAPELPATTLSGMCYYYMFEKCTSLLVPPELPALSIPSQAYRGMFADSGIKISTTQHDDYTTSFRFPTTGTGSVSNTLDIYEMFLNCGVDTVDVNTTYYVLTNSTYTTTKFELLHIANAIRARGNTSASLTYPTDFVTAVGNIPGITPTDSLSILSNGTYNVTNYASAVVNVPQSGMTMTTTQDSHGGDILTITGSVYNAGYTLIDSAEYAISNFTTTSATSHSTISLGSSNYTANKIIYVKVRDKAGPRNGYFVGSDAYFFNYYDANSATTTLAVRPIIIFRKSSDGVYTGYAAGSNTGYGVYPYQLTSAGVLSIYKRYSSTYSLTIDGTYVVEVYALDYAPTGNPFNYNYPTTS